VKVRKWAFGWSATSRVVLAAIFSVAAFSVADVAQAHTITRKEVIKRANHWIKKKVRYSQSSYYQGYRRDCSGFVSMAWKLRGSYTSSSIRGVARRISASRLKPGDAVRRSGHVEIFGGWKNKRKRTYWALEESNYGKPALRKVKRFKRGYSALRLRGIKDAPPKPKTRPKVELPPVNPPSKPIPSPEPTPSILATAPLSGEE
jgi:hypothetical protein